MNVSSYKQKAVVHIEMLCLVTYKQHTAMDLLQMNKNVQWIFYMVFIVQKGLMENILKHKFQWTVHTH